MQEVEAEKQKNLKGESKSSMEKHAPGWNEKLASDSEQKVKALKDERCKGAMCCERSLANADHLAAPEQLQKDTVEHQKKSK